MKKYFIPNLVLAALAIGHTSSAYFYRHDKHHIIHTISHESPAQGDTLQYIKTNVVDQKAKYQHKELSTLLNDLIVSVKTFTPVLGRIPGGPLKCLILYFDDKKIIADEKQKMYHYNFINVYFEEPLQMNTVMSMYIKDAGKWTSEENSFFGKLVVKDIQGVQLSKREK